MTTVISELADVVVDVCEDKIHLVGVLFHIACILETSTGHRTH